MDTTMLLLFAVLASRERGGGIPLTTVVSSLDAVPAPVRFVAATHAVRDVQRGAETRDARLRAELQELFEKKKIDADDLKTFPETAKFVDASSKTVAASDGTLVASGTRSGTHNH